MNTSLRMCLALTSVIMMLSFSNLTLAHEDSTVRQSDNARNHLVTESMPAVYNIELRGTVSDTKTGAKKSEGVVLALGSGFGVTKDGLVLTKMHVVNPGFEKSVARLVAPNTFAYENGNTITVTILLTSGSGSKHRATFVGGDLNGAVDIALIKITEPTKNVYPLLTIADSALGYDEVVSIGSPLGFVFTVGDGIVSNPDIVIEGIHFVQTTALMLPGSSGGPLIRIRDHTVVGMMDSIYVLTEDTNLGLGFATTAPVLKEFLKKELRRLANEPQ